jgi:exodeoxyribonuclease VIII
MTKHIPIRHGHLKWMAKSPMHCHHAMLQDSVETKAQRRGTVVHAMLFGTTEVVRIPDGAPKRPSSAQRRAKKPSPDTIAAINFWDAFEHEHEGHHVLSADEYETFNGMAEAVRNDPKAMDLITASRLEETIYFTLAGRSCRTTPDGRGPDFCFELKTTRDADPEQFRWQSRKLSYSAQQAWHLTGMEMGGYGKHRNAYTIAVEENARMPGLHPVTVFKISEAALQNGDRCNRLWFERLISCEQSGQWPPYAQTIVELDDTPDSVELDWSNMPEDDEEEAA